MREKKILKDGKNQASKARNRSKSKSCKKQKSGMFHKKSSRSKKVLENARRRI